MLPLSPPFRTTTSPSTAEMMAATTPDDPVLVLNVFYVPYVLYAPYVPCPISQYFRHGTLFYVQLCPFWADSRRGTEFHGVALFVRFRLSLPSPLPL